MKKIITVILFAVLTGCANANGYYGGNYYYQNNEWVVPLIGGVAIGTVIGNMYRQPQPVYMPPTIIYPPTYPGIPRGYHYETIYDGYIGSYRTVIVPN
jgi:hypothetical protein